jgi:ABC-type branched-subunit amino acid transport system substrate-binding protein
MAARKVNDKVVVHDPAVDQKAQAKTEAAEVGGERRKAHIEALRTELTYLEHQPVPNGRRIAEVRAEITRASKAGGRAAGLETAGG